MMDKKSLSVDAIFLIFARALHSILLFLPLIILSRILSYDDYGSYKQVFLITSLIVPLFSLAIPQSINFFMPQLDKRKQKTFIYQTFIFLIIIGFLMSVFLFFGADYIASFFNNLQLANILKIFSLYPLFYLPVQIYSNFLSSIKKIKLLCSITILFGMIHLSAILIPVIAGMSLKSIFVFLLFNSVLQFITLFFMLHFLYKKDKLELDKHLFKDQLIFSLPLALSSVIGIINIKIGQLIVSHFFSTEQYAIFSNGAFELPFMDILLGSVMAVIIPYLVISYKEKRKEDYLNLWHNSIIKMSLLTIPITTFIIVFSKEIILILYGDKYLLSVPLFAVFSIILYSRLTIYGDVLRTMNKTKFILISAFVSLLLNVLLNLAFILFTPLELLGPAIAAVIAQYTVNLLQLYFIKKTLKLSFGKIFPWGNLSKLFLISLISVPLALSVKVFNLNIFINIILGAFFYFAVFYLIVYFSNVSNSRNIIEHIYKDLTKLLYSRK